MLTEHRPRQRPALLPRRPRAARGGELHRRQRRAGDPAARRPRDGRARRRGARRRDRRARGGRRVGGPVRLAFEVADAAVATDDLVGAGAELVAGPVRTPWGSVNARLDGPDGQPLTVYANDHYVMARPRLDATVHLADPDDEWPVTAAALVRRQVREVVGRRRRRASPTPAPRRCPGWPPSRSSTSSSGCPTRPTRRRTSPGWRRWATQLRIREPEWREHRLLRRDEPAANLHVFASGDDEISRMLAFRDHLRARRARPRVVPADQARAGRRGRGSTSRTTRTPSPTSWPTS